MNIKEAYEQGFKDGLAAYAINKDGDQWVGDPKRTLKEAIEDIKNTWNFNPPEEKE